jgi:hypothetical protein
MFLILSLTFLVPFWQGRVALQTFEALLSSKPLPMAAVIRMSIVVAVYSGLALYSLVAGVMLWVENRHAAQVAKSYLIVSLLTVCVLFSGYKLAGIDVDLTRILIQRGVYACLWYAYLERSRRIRLTYGPAAEVIPVTSPSSPAAA